MPLKSISRKIARSAIAVTMTIVLAFGSVSYLVMRANMRAQIRQQITFEGRYAIQRIQSLLENINHEVGSMSRNIIFVNALIDSEGMDFYTAPFIRTYRLPENIPFVLTLCDFEGKPITSSAEEMPEYTDEDIVATVVDRESPYAGIIHDDRDEHELLIVYPVFYGATGMAEGMLVMQVPVEYILRLSFGPMFENEGAPFIKTAGIMWSYAGHNDGYLMSPVEGAVDKVNGTSRFDSSIALSPPLDSLKLVFSVFEDTARAYRPLSTMAWIYVLAGLSILVITFAVSRKMALLLARPLVGLAEHANKVSFEDGCTATFEVSQDDEVGKLARAFNNMVERLRDSHEDLDARVRERTGELETANAEKEVLLREIHHRVKNNMAIISSLLQLQSRRSADQGTVQMLKDSQNRINSMALVHQKLYLAKNLSQIDVKDYVTDLVNHIIETFPEGRRNIILNIQIEKLVFSIDRLVPCGLILNELVTNSMKHAFQDVNSPEIGISIVRRDGEVVMDYRDNGKGLPENMEFHNSDSLGLQLIDVLTHQLKGRLDMDPSERSRIVITFQAEQEAS